MTDGAEESLLPEAMLNCAHCGWGEVPMGPKGGYVCPQCFHTEEPPSVSVSPSPDASRRRTDTGKGRRPRRRPATGR